MFQKERRETCAIASCFYTGDSHFVASSAAKHVKPNIGIPPHRNTDIMTQVFLFEIPSEILRKVFPFFSLFPAIYLGNENA